MTTYTLIASGQNPDPSFAEIPVPSSSFLRAPNPNKAVIFVAMYGSGNVNNNTPIQTIIGRGMTFEPVVARTYMYSNVAIWAAPSGATPAASGDLAVDYGAMPNAAMWWVFEADNLDISDLIRQVAEYVFVEGDLAPDVDFPAPIAVAGASSILGIGGINSDTADIVPNAGLVSATAAKQSAPTPNMSARVLREANGGAKQNIGWTPSPSTATANKYLVGVEFNVFDSSNQPPQVTATSSVAQAAALEVVTLTGVAVDTDGVVIETRWEQVLTPGVPTIEFAGVGSVVNFTSPALMSDQIATFRFTAVDEDRASSSVEVNVLIKRHRFWVMQGGVDLPRFPQNGGITLPPPDPTAAVNITISLLAGSGTVDMTYSTTKNGRNVAGVFIGRNGPNSENANIGYETPEMVDTLVGTRTFGKLVNGFEYTFYVEPVVDGVRRPDMRRSATIVPSGDGGGGPDPDPDLPQWDLFYATEFAEASLTGEGWQIESGPANNMNSYDLPRNCMSQAVGNGKGLIIRGKREGGYSRPYTCGDMKGMGNKLNLPNYFRVEVTGRSMDVVGLWPCFMWFRPWNPGDVAGEIDLMEYMGGLFSGAERRVAITMHNEYGVGVQDSWKAPVLWRDLTNPSITDTHKYTLEKTPGMIKAWIDDDVHLTRYFGVTQEVLDHLPQNGLLQPKSWWNRIMEQNNKRWYPRINLQIGDGREAGGKFVVPEPPSGWTQSDMEVDSMKLWVPAAA